MKKYFLTIAMVAAQMVVVAQTVNVHFKNGQKIEFPSDNVDYVDFSAKASDPTLTPGQAVDLGLSVYWASCNLGATKPEEYGDYYAWGETSPKSQFTKDNYSYYDSNMAQYIDIGENISGTQYDAATVNWGSDWRMPTRTEMKELIDNCTWQWTQVSGNNGYKVTGPNGNSIFLPAAGYCTYKAFRQNELVYCWTANKNTYNAYVYYLWATSSIYNVTNSEPGHYGKAIRPVTSNPNAK